MVRDMHMHMCAIHGRIQLNLKSYIQRDPQRSRAISLVRLLCLSA
jgi:hypothetical protein